MKNFIIYFIAFLSFITSCGVNKGNSQKVFLITLDGVRWQEVFTGADSLLINDSTYSKNKGYLNTKYWDPDFNERRKKLTPFLWSEIARNGQLYGNRKFDNNVNLTNKHWFSFPGYSEILCGFADDERVNSNAKVDNPNKTILEVANDLPEFKGKVGAFGSWDAFTSIINEKRSGLNVNAGYNDAVGPGLTEKEKYLNELQRQAIQPWVVVRQDVFTYNFAFEFIKRKQPKLMCISFGETDDFAHDGDYEHYLLSIENTDNMIGQLWSYCQSNEYYKDKTTFIITTDHGRGSDPIEEWKSHGQNLVRGGITYNIKGSDETWLAVIGPNVEAKGEMQTSVQLYASQIFSTIKELLQIDFDGPENQEPMPIFK
jgi:hypothetical protein